MKGGPHPTYPNPSLLEAACTIYFDLGDSGNQGQKLQESWFSRFFHEIQKDYPNFEPTVDFTLQFTAQGHPQESVNALSVPPIKGAKFSHSKKPYVVRLQPHALSISAVAHYEGWAAYSKRIQNAWKAWNEIAQPQTVKAIALRYINRLGQFGEFTNAQEVLVANDYIPQKALEAGRRFHLKLDGEYSEGERFVIQSAEIHPKERKEPYAYLLDITRASEKPCAPSPSEILKKINAMHEDVWEIFDSSVSLKMKKHMGKKPKNV